ncbi:putative lipoprotein [Staphylococcus aureus]|nr:putative lipoprotein [Staphylococcus aureus]
MHLVILVTHILLFLSKYIKEYESNYETASDDSLK